MKLGQEGSPSSTKELPQSDQSCRQPIWHVVVLTCLTLLAYTPFWFYKNAAQLRAFAQAVPENDQLEMRFGKQPAMALRFFRKWTIFHTICLFVPGVDVILAFLFFVNAARLYPRSTPILKNSWVAGAVMTVVLVALLCLATRPGLQYLLCLHASLVLALAQYFINDFWKRVEPPELVVRAAFSVGELLALIVGSLWLGLILAGPSVHH